MLTLSCKNVDCLLRLRVGRILNAPVTRVGELGYCPRCSQEADVTIDESENYWELLSRSYGVNPEAIQAIHSIWDPKTHPIFRHFVFEMLEEAGIKVAS